MTVAVQFFAGTKFYVGLGGYFRSGQRGKNELMHRVVYSATYGNIPHGWQVHHRDRDPGNNTLENLVCQPRSEHLTIPRARGDIGVLRLICARCGGEYETPNKGGRHGFCSGRCKTAFYKAEKRQQ